jgi:hypothetical protein
VENLTAKKKKRMKTTYWCYCISLLAWQQVQIGIQNAYILMIVEFSLSFWGSSSS